ncbi:hypothetical protein CBR_g1159 [Chara braunii]|uniref:Reverse transcriptase domain-containing protein n=1 Tax=Chara braunii TaxID=69332 RepID=A0A388KDC0_CHABU|nr:hypothetical protein CBR_g1159 [Chara braunii]|eukprot:GBG68039.1 hypothetical protein CBR_g1159 [Chara braunii]
MNVTFQNFVNKTRLTQGMINFCVIVYMDNILVYSETYHGHAQHIEWTLGALRDAGFKIALEKGEFFLSEISFLGYIVTRGGLRSDSRKVAAVLEAPVPTSLTQVRAFLGLASYYWRFIKGFAAIAQPLTNLLRKDQPLSWDAECKQAFATLKEALAMLVDDLPLKIISQSDESPVPHVLTRTFTPYLRWSACLEEPGSSRNPPSQRDYLNPREIIDLAFFQDRAASGDEEIVIEEESIVEEEEEEAAEEDEDETPEEGSYSEHSEGEQSEEEEENEEEDQEEEEEGELELEESEWEISAEELERTEAQQAEDPEAARKRDEIAAGKRQLEFASAANFPITDDPAHDPEPPKPEMENRPRLRPHQRGGDKADPPPPPPPAAHQFEPVLMRGIGLRPRLLSRRPLDHLTLRQITTRVTFPRNPFPIDTVRFFYVTRLVATIHRHPSTR